MAKRNLTPAEKKQTEYYMAEIRRKLVGLNYATIDIANGGHSSTLHIGLTDEDLVRRQRQGGKKTVSSFYSNTVFDACIYTFLDINIKAVAEWLADESDLDRFVEEDILPTEEMVGKVLLPNGGILNTHMFRVVFQKNDRRTGAAGMPFDVVNMYPINPAD